jgi:hypothetical protein
MTLQEELKIYKQMLKAFRKQYWFGWMKHKYWGYPGFCYYLYEQQNITDIKECSHLHLLNPTNKEYGFWFHSYEMKPRIKLLKKAIKICNQEIRRQDELDYKPI